MRREATWLRSAAAIETFHDFRSQSIWLTRIADVVSAHVAENDEFFGSIVANEGLRQSLPPKSALVSPKTLAVWARDAGELII